MTNGADVIGLQRREVLRRGALGALAFWVNGAAVLMTPAAAHAAALDLRVLQPEDRIALEALGEIILPGAKAAGLAHYVDHQLAGSAEDCLLGIRLSDAARPPYLPIYRAMLAALNAASGAQGFVGLTSAEQVTLVTTMSRGEPASWSGPIPARQVFGTVRSDCLDVIYGTEAGFDRLELPYMAHIAPERPW